MGKRSTVLVTGGAGYIGSHTCKVLSDAGYRPVTFDNLSLGHERSVRWGPLEVGDLGDPDRVMGVLETHRPIAVVHFAALAYVGESVQHPEKYYRNNVCGSFNLLAAMAATGVDKIVFSSSCATYGVPSRVPISESHPQVPVNAYGRTKLAVEYMIRDFTHAYGLRAVCLRYFNAAGADLDGEIGEDHDPETHAIPRAILTALGKSAPFEIYGSDYPTPDGTAIRDYIHVCDLADGHLRALALLESGESFAAVNLGTGRGHSVQEVVAAVERVTGRPVARVAASRREGDPPELVADPSLARRVLGWSPRVTDLDAMIATAYRWLNRETTED